MPTSDQKKLWMGMARIVKHLSTQAGHAVDEATGLNLSEMTLMGQIRALGGSARMVDLATMLQVSKPAITKLVDGLEKEGRVCRTDDPEDRRVVRIQLEEKGTRILSQAEAVFEQTMFEGLWKHLSTQETHRVVQVLDRIQNSLGLKRAGIMP